jgi:hypothetical protein
MEESGQLHAPAALPLVTIGYDVMPNELTYQRTHSVIGLER